MLPILNRIMVAGGLLGIVLVAVLAAQSPGLFSTLEVDGNATFYASGIIDAHNLHTATGSSTGAGERPVSLPSEYLFEPFITGDPLCAMTNRTNDGWFIETYDPSRYGQFSAPGLSSADVRGMAVVGDALWSVNEDGTLTRALRGTPATVASTSIPGVSSPDFSGLAFDGGNLLALDRATETGYTRGSIWTVTPVTSGTTATRTALPTSITLADVADFAGIAVDSDYVWIGVAPNKFWRLPLNLSSATSFTGPAALDSMSGLTSQGSDLWVSTDATSSVTIALPEPNSQSSLEASWRITPGLYMPGEFMASGTEAYFRQLGFGITGSASMSTSTLPSSGNPFAPGNEAFRAGFQQRG